MVKTGYTDDMIQYEFVAEADADLIAYNVLNFKYFALLALAGKMLSDLTAMQPHVCLGVACPICKNMSKVVHATAILKTLQMEINE